MKTGTAKNVIANASRTPDNWLPSVNDDRATLGIEQVFALLDIDQDMFTDAKNWVLSIDGQRHEMWGLEGGNGRESVVISGSPRAWQAETRRCKRVTKRVCSNGETWTEPSTAEQRAQDMAGLDPDRVTTAMKREARFAKIKVIPVR